MTQLDMNMTIVDVQDPNAHLHHHDSMTQRGGVARTLMLISPATRGAIRWPDRSGPRSSLRTATSSSQLDEAACACSPSRRLRRMDVPVRARGRRRRVRSACPGAGSDACARARRPPAPRTSQRVNNADGGLAIVRVGDRRQIRT
jgi:hypothetical protein